MEEEEKEEEEEEEEEVDDRVERRGCERSKFPQKSP